MKPVDMQVMHDEERGICGDCLRACFASVLGLPAERVPHFVQLAADEEKDESVKHPRSHWHFVQEFLRPLGLCYITVDRESSGACWLAHNAGHHLIIGQSPRGDFQHAVVGYQGEMVHDPHPSRDGIGDLVCFGYFVPLDPSLELEAKGIEP